MNPERWARLEELFHRLSDLPAAERRAILDTECVDDPEVRAQLDLMLESNDDESSRIEGAVEAGLGWVRDEADGPPSHIGPYRVLREIGRGGLATVYLAERADDQFDMRVAIKVVRRGMDTDDILRRLRRERQILARLNHPNIARLLDGGTTDAGVPYFVMEHIVGDRIDVYCRDKRLNLEDRLRLFRQVCSAVDYAHRNLVLHRDLKPSNLMVTHDGIPKLLDFGIAKVLDPDDTSSAEPMTGPTLTRTGFRLLTPSYASPEQVRGEPLSTASDVYSLGMMLYQLLVGRLPYRINTHRPSEIERLVCRVEVEAPSVRLAESLAGETADLGVDLLPGARPKDLQGDLDTVVLAALHKDPERRYSSAAALAEDLRRYLEALPVLARRDTLAYRVGKFVRRHRLSLSAVAVVIGLLLTSMWVTLHQAERAREALAVAEAAQNRSEFQADFLIGLFEASDPWQRPGTDITAEQMLEIGSGKIEALIQNDPMVAGALMETMGRTYQNRNHFEEAEELFDRALIERARHFGPQSLEVAKSRRALGELSFEEDELLQADRQLTIALQTFTDLLGPEHPEVAATLYGQAGVFKAEGRLDESERALRRVLDIYRLSPEGHFLDMTEARNRLAEVLFEKGQPADAEGIFRRVLEQRRSLGEHPDLAVSLNNLAVVLHELERFDEAGEMLREALELRRRLFGRDHSDVAQSLYNLAMFELGQGRSDGVDRLFEEALDIHQRLFSGDHSSRGDYLYGLGLWSYAEGQLERATELLEQALDVRRKTLGDHSRVAISLRKLADVNAEQGHREQAEGYFLDLVELQRRLYGAGDSRVYTTLLELGELQLEMGKLSWAIAHLQEAVDGLRMAADYGPNHWRTAWAEGQLGRALAGDDQREAAVSLLETSLRTLWASLGDHRRTREVEARLAQIRSNY